MNARNMSGYYRLLSQFELLTLRSKKKSRLSELQRGLSYGDAQERRRLEYNLRQIDVELACRAAQLSLPLE